MNATRRFLFTLPGYMVWRQTKGLKGANEWSVHDRLRRGVIWRTCSHHTKCPPDCHAGRLDAAECDRRWAEDDKARAERVHRWKRLPPA